VRYPHPALRYKARPLTQIDARVRLYAEQMLELMYANRGLGLAATQCALPLQMFVMNSQSDPMKPELEGVYINPVIQQRTGTIEGDEGCLSFPELFQKVRRARHVKVHAYNLQGQLVEVQAGDLAARVFQHEIDHLDGVLFIDKLGTIGRLAARGTLREFEREFEKARERGEIPPEVQIRRSMDELADNLAAPILA
jgi:peptide deformylase